MNNITIYKLLCSGKVRFYCQTSDGQKYVWHDEVISDNHLHWLSILSSECSGLISSNRLEFLLLTGVSWEMAIDCLRWTKLVNSFKRTPKNI